MPRRSRWEMRLRRSSRGSLWKSLHRRKVALENVLGRQVSRAPLPRACRLTRRFRSSSQPARCGTASDRPVLPAVAQAADRTLGARRRLAAPERLPRLGVARRQQISARRRIAAPQGSVPPRHAPPPRSEGRPCRISGWRQSWRATSAQQEFCDGSECAHIRRGCISKQQCLSCRSTP